MTSAANDILSKALTLPPEARAQIAEQLLASLDPAQGEIDEAWRNEVEARLKEIDEGTAELIPHEQVMAEARARLRAKRGT